MIARRSGVYGFSGSIFTAYDSRGNDVAIIAKTKVNWWGVWRVTHDARRGPLLKEFRTYGAASAYAEATVTGDPK